MRRLLALLLLLIPIAAVAQSGGLDIGLVSGNEGSLPIVVVPMPYQGAGPAPDTDVASVIRNDLNRSGQFKSLPVESIIEQPTRGSEIRFPTWRVLRQDFVVVGRVLDAGDGGYRVEYELYDVAKQERLLGLAVGGRAKGMRRSSNTQPGVRIGEASRNSPAER